MSALRIAIAGFQHETNTFAPFNSGIDAFRMADSWPELLRGQDVISGMRGLNIPIAGAISRAEEAGGIELLPILWCAAEPSGPVTDDAFERIGGMILDGIERAGPIDAIYLDLHGAMVTESHQDGEGELLARIRRQVGSGIPIGVSLDLHANLSAEVAGLADVITIFRTYPHLDMAETGDRAMQELLQHISAEPRAVAFRQMRFLVPLQAQYTGMDPCRGLYRLLDTLPSADGEYVDLAMGFTAADVVDCGPSVVAYAGTPARAEGLADRVASEFIRAESGFDTFLLDPYDAVRQAMAMEGMVVLADVQDNPGAGGSSDTTGLLAALVDERADDALLGVVCDPEIARKASELGIGARFRGALGGKAGPEGQKPFEAEYEVLALSDGNIPYSGEMYGGGVARIGESCLLRVCDDWSDIRIVVSSIRTQCLDCAFFTHFGQDPAKARIVCVKSTVHFRAAFEPISQAILNVAAPGLFPCDLSKVSYAKTSKPPATGFSQRSKTAEG